MSQIAPSRDTSFLGRLAEANRADEQGSNIENPPVPSIDRKLLLALIVRNLNHVLRSRKRYDCVMNDFGLGDYDDPSNIDVTIQRLVTEITDAILTYEPRLISPVVLAVSRDSQTRIQLSITGLVMGETCKLKAQFEVRSRYITVNNVVFAAAGVTDVEIAQSLQRKVTVKES